MKISHLLLFSLITLSHLVAQPPQPQPTYKLLPGRNFVQSKNYYLLTLFQELTPVRQLLERDPELIRLLQLKRDSIGKAPTNCGADRFCYTRPMKFSNADIALVSSRLTALYSPENALGKLVTEHLILSGTYVLYHKLPPGELLTRAWEQDAQGVNFVIGVYAEGNKPNYPAIDSISYPVADRRYVGFLKTATETIGAEIKSATLFFEPSLTAALRFLEVNEREQAADFEPMATTVNRLPLERTKRLNWNNYKYTLILVLGSGPQEHGIPLSGDAMMRLRMAALRYHEGLAPFMVVSGGKVHPYKTRFCEAIEMKRYLIEKLQVPEDAILVDPHARHTTTNIRNTVRLIYRYGFPFAKPCIVSSASSHIQSVMDVSFDRRCERELKHVPLRKGVRLSATEGEFYPVIDALHINPTEPLDP